MVGLLLFLLRPARSGVFISFICVGSLFSFLAIPGYHAKLIAVVRYVVACRAAPLLPPPDYVGIVARSCCSVPRWTHPSPGCFVLFSFNFELRSAALSRPEAEFVLSVFALLLSTQVRASVAS